MAQTLKNQSLWPLARWIITAHLALQTVLFIWAMNGVTSGFDLLSSLNQTGLSCAALCALWLRGESTTPALGASGFAFRSGVLWCSATIVLLLNHGGYGLGYGDIAFITSQVMGTVFAVLTLGVIGIHMNRGLHLPLPQSLFPAFLVTGSFLTELVTATIWPKAPVWVFGLLSLSDATSAIIVIWMLVKLETIE